MRIVSILLSLVLVLCFVPILRQIAPTLGLLDLPTARKRHDGAVPLVGGLAMFLAFIVTIPTLGLGAAASWSFLFGAAAFVLLGALDDRQPMSSKRRLAVQVAIVSTAVIAGGNVLPHLGALGGGGYPVSLGAAAIPFTVFGLLGVLNAMNFTDGADGLAGGAEGPGGQGEGDDDWSVYEHSNQVAARWVFQREVKRMFAKALQVASTADAKFDAKVGLGSPAHKHIIDTAKNVVDAYVRDGVLVQSPVDPYVVGDAMCRPA